MRCSIIFAATPKRRKEREGRLSSSCAPSVPHPYPLFTLEVGMLVLSPLFSLAVHVFVIAQQSISPLLPLLSCFLISTMFVYVCACPLLHPSLKAWKVAEQESRREGDMGRNENCLSSRSPHTHGQQRKKKKRDSLLFRLDGDKS